MLDGHKSLIVIRKINLNSQISFVSISVTSFFKKGRVTNSTNKLSHTSCNGIPSDLEEYQVAKVDHSTKINDAIKSVTVQIFTTPKYIHIFTIKISFQISVLIFSENIN